MPGSGELGRPLGWYIFAGGFLLCAAFLVVLLFVSSRLHPAEFPAGVDYAMMAGIAGLAAAAYGCVRLGRALARGRPWAHAAVATAYFLIALVHLVALVAGIAVLLDRAG